MKLIQKSIYSTVLALALSTNSFADCSYELFTISSTKNTKIIDFIEQLSDECAFSIIVTDPNAEKFLNSKLNKTNLKNLTIDEVLGLILVENNLSYTLQNNILKISYLTTKVFAIDYILSQITSEGSTDVTLSSSSSASSTSTGGTTGGAEAGGSSAGMKITSTDEVKFWEALDTEFQSVLNRPHDAYVASTPIINKNAGLVTVTATTQQLKRFESYLERLQEKVQLQVLIDVQLLSVTMNAGSSTGIDWKQLYALQNIQVSAQSLHNNNVDAWTNTGSALDITTTTIAANTIHGVADMVSVKAGGSLNEVIKFLKSQGDVSSISNPKVLTLNNQPALITAGTEYFYKITSTETLAGTGATSTSSDEDVKSIFSGVLLSITPEISDDKTITLKINPSLSETTTDISAVDNSDRKMPPDLNRRQLSSVVTVKDGNRIIIGGLINTSNSNSSDKVPLLGDIPVLGYLFKYEEKVKTVRELVIIIEPHIIHKEINSVSLSDLGYEGLTDELLTLESASNPRENDIVNVENSPKDGKK
jgi:general secretion pathway protein D